VARQSSGKSSVVEAFVGRDFIPCCSDIYTRRLIVLQPRGRVPAPPWLPLLRLQRNPKRDPGPHPLLIIFHLRRQLGSIVCSQGVRDIV
jgi:hypothetical protein